MILYVTREFGLLLVIFGLLLVSFECLLVNLKILLVNLCVSLKFAAFTPAFLSLFWRNSNTSCLYIIFL
ncbi:hypothetical protein AB4X15_15950 [Peribacillus simplex]|uniref:hypothetical protein n=1 Tax=Peribacillus simplex TaxID=1478 RepID=UPI0034E8D514